jgi:cation transport regulator ChaB
MSSFELTPEELNVFVGDVLDEHLSYFAHALIHAAQEEYKHTIHTRTFTVAVGGVALHGRYGDDPMRTIARRSLVAHEGLQVVGEQYPDIMGRRDSEWLDALDDAWGAVQFRPEALQPKDRTDIGHIELLEALRKHKAGYWHGHKATA